MLLCRQFHCVFHHHHKMECQKRKDGKKLGEKMLKFVQQNELF